MPWNFSWIFHHRLISCLRRRLIVEPPSIDCHLLSQRSSSTKDHAWTSAIAFCLRLVCWQIESRPVFSLTRVSFACFTPVSLSCVSFASVVFTITSFGPVFFDLPKLRELRELRFHGFNLRELRDVSIHPCGLWFWLARTLILTRTNFTSVIFYPRSWSFSHANSDFNPRELCCFNMSGLCFLPERA